MVSVTADEVRARFQLSDTDISDVQTQKFRDEAAAWLSGEIDETLDHADCTEEEANAIRNLAALYCFCWVNGGSAVGLSFSLGDINIGEGGGKQFDFYKEQVERYIARKTEIAFIVGVDETSTR